MIHNSAVSELHLEFLNELPTETRILILEEFAAKTGCLISYTSSPKNTVLEFEGLNLEKITSALKKLNGLKHPSRLPITF